MRLLALLLAVFLTGCFVTPGEVAEAERLCEPYGGWRSISDPPGRNVFARCVDGQGFTFDAPAEPIQ